MFRVDIDFVSIAFLFFWNSWYTCCANGAMRFAYKSSHSIDWPRRFFFCCSTAAAASVTTFVWHSSNGCIAPLQQFNKNQFNFILFVYTSRTQSNHHFWHSSSHSTLFRSAFSFRFVLSFHEREKNHFIEVKQFTLKRLIHDNNIGFLSNIGESDARENKIVNNAKLFTVDAFSDQKFLFFRMFRCFLCVLMLFVMIAMLIGIGRRSISVLFCLHNKCVCCRLHACAFVDH